MSTRSIDVTDIVNSDDLSRLIDDIEVAQARVILRRGGREVAMLSPLPSGHLPADAPPLREISEEDRAASRAAAGSWAGNVDFEAWERARAESRSLPPKPPVDLGDFGKPE